MLVGTAVVQTTDVFPVGFDDVMGAVVVAAALNIIGAGLIKGEVGVGVGVVAVFTSALNAVIDLPSSTALTSCLMALSKPPCNCTNA